MTNRDRHKDAWAFIVDEHQEELARETKDGYDLEAYIQQEMEPIDIYG